MKFFQTYFNEIKNSLLIQIENDKNKGQKSDSQK